MRRLGVSLRPAIAMRRRAGASGSDRPWREVERAGGDRPAAADERAARGRERQLPRSHRRADARFSRSKASSTISARAPARSGAGARDAEASRGREGARRRRRDGSRTARLPSVVSHRCSSPEDTFGVLRDLLQRPREPAQLRAPRRRAAGGAGGRDAVDLAGARLADRHASAAAAIRSPASRLPPGPRHLDRQGPAGLRDRGRHRRVGRATPATTAT